MYVHFYITKSILYNSYSSCLLALQNVKFGEGGVIQWVSTWVCIPSIHLSQVYSPFSSDGAVGENRAGKAGVNNGKNYELVMFYGLMHLIFTTNLKFRYNPHFTDETEGI